MGGLAPGNWDWVNVGQGSGANQLGNAVQDGASSSFSIGQTINSVPGNKGNAGPVKKGFDARLASCSAAANSNFAGSAFDPCANGAAVGAKVEIKTESEAPPGAVPLNDPCLVTVPAVDFTGCNGNCSLTIEGFAQIYLEQSTTSSEIDGCFVQGSTTSNLHGSATAPNLGPTTPPDINQLVRRP